MQHPPVHWAEGIFLRPHHFQAADRYWNELFALQQQFDHPVGYGLSRIEISAEALAGGILEIRSLRARMKSGEILAQSEGDVQRVELGERAEAITPNRPLRVFLAVAQLQSGRGNVDGNTPAAPGYRFAEFTREIDDESSGGNRQTLRLKRLNFRIMLDDEDTSGFETLEICRIRRAASGEGNLILDPDFFPPVMHIQAWPPLAQIVRTIRDELHSRIQSVCTQIQEKSINLSSQTQGDMEKMLLLHSMNPLAAELGVLAFAPGTHPLVAFTSLCRGIGGLSLFGPRLTPPEIPRYDHDDAAPLFRWARERIRELIFSVKEDLYHQRYFTGAGLGMLVRLDPEWFGPEWEWYFGINPTNTTSEQCRMLLKQINVKIGSHDKVDSLFVRNEQGVVLQSARQPPRALPTSSGWLFYQIIQDNLAWRDVQATHTLAMRFQSELIANRETLEGSRSLRLSMQGRMYALEFAIFAVRKRM